MSWLLGFATTTFHHGPAPVQLPLKKKTSTSSTADLADIVKSSTPPCNLSPFLPGGHVQTVSAAFNKNETAIRFKRTIFESKHQTYPGTYAVDFVSHDGPQSQTAQDRGENCPPRTTLFERDEWERFTGDAQNDTPLIIILHGLSGGSHENYLQETILPLVHPSAGSGLQEWDACVVNSRGCAYTKLSTPVMYNARATWDMRQTVRWAREKWPKRPLFGMGFSLGANILVNYLGEEGENCPLDGALALSNPWDLQVAHVSLNSSFIGREIYSKSMGASMVKLFKRHKDVLAANPKVNAEKILASKYLWQFDRSLQAPVWGYPTENSYYRDASSVEMLLNVKIPLMALNAEDDPVTAFAGCPVAEVQQVPFAVLVSTSCGGHLGWFELGGGRWMAKPVNNFLRKLAEEVDLKALQALRSAHKVPNDIKGPQWQVLRRRLEVPIPP